MEWLLLYEVFVKDLFCLVDSPYLFNGLIFDSSAYSLQMPSMGSFAMG
jgi:hypothetical protein